jgi:hypothetical protein
MAGEQEEEEQDVRWSARRRAFQDHTRGGGVVGSSIIKDDCVFDSIQSSC